MNSSAEPIALDLLARVPTPGDNVAIAVRRLEAGTSVRHGEEAFTLPHTVMEGHRLVLEPIPRGGHLLSWGLPFGIATRDLVPGEYVCNEKILRVLAERDIDFELPGAANFEDHLERFELDETTFEPGQQVARVEEPGTFLGFRRPGKRGVGTRNFIVVLATTSRACAFAEALAAKFEAIPKNCSNIDGIVPVTHTEGATDEPPHNLDLVLRTLAGFMVHPNVGAVLAVDYPGAGYGNDELRNYMAERSYSLSDVAHRFLTIESDFTSELSRAEAVIRKWLPAVNTFERTGEPLSELKVALQCGGSDAFSGVSGNALAGWVAKLLIQHGGSANLAETDELIGAEPYVLENVRDVETARHFLEKIEQFKERARHHGATAEGNPSGGNNYRGLYNIALKSIGAARKRDREVRLDHVLDYAAPMREPGYYFMDSPGNDLESIASQVASGCNIIFFITGNGSITNFPFVPTLKFVTTSGRFEMLANEMDVNAGRYNDGVPMDALGDETFALARRIAAGERSKGELAGHAQVQIWRDWPQTDDTELEVLLQTPAPDGAPLAVAPAQPSRLRFSALDTENGMVCDQIGLVMPTSLCSGQIARLIVEDLNQSVGTSGPVTRYVALVHTEGCGSVNTDDLYLQTLLGYLRHPFVRRAVLLEHGCERTHNDAVRHYLERHSVETSHYGWASVQLDGGIEKVKSKVEEWFRTSLHGDQFPNETPADAGALSLGLLALGSLPDHAASALAALARGIVAAGGTVVVPASGTLADNEGFRERLLAAGDQWHPTLGYGEPFERPGLHAMDAPTAHPTELMTGLGGTGVQLMIAHVGTSPLQAHPMIPTLQVSGEPAVRKRFADDLDVELDPEADSETLVKTLEARLADVASRAYAPHLVSVGATGFQLTRGRLGLSL
jgi:altronate dehydratase